MPTDTTVNNLVINELTKAQYDEIENPSDTELYLVSEVIDISPTNGSENLVTSGGVYTALSSKANTSDVVTSIGGSVTVSNIQVVTNLPSSPDANTLYLIRLP